MKINYKNYSYNLHQSLNVASLNKIKINHETFHNDQNFQYSYSKPERNAKLIKLNISPAHLINLNVSLKILNQKFLLTNSNLLNTNEYLHPTYSIKLSIETDRKFDTNKQALTQSKREGRSGMTSRAILT